MTESLADALTARFPGRAFGPGDAEWDVARHAYNLALDQQPDAVVFAESDDDVAEVVGLAGERGLRVAPQGTGHGAGALGGLDGAILLRTERMTGAEVDAGQARARVRAGARWMDVVPLCDPHGLAPLSGTSATVRVAGYTLGGGVGFLARAHGLACNSVLAADVVTADGRRLHVDADHEPDLFWALRGGGGNFAVVTGLEFALHPAPEIHAGALFWPMERAAEVLHAWREWLPSTPVELTSTARLLQLPPIPDLPDHLRGRSFVVVQGALLGGAERGAALWGPLLDLEPEMNTMATMPPSGLATINMDPPEPVPYAGDGGLLGGLPEEAVDALLAVHGPGAGSPLLAVEIRQLGGALAEPAPGGGALASIPAPFAWFAVGVIPDPALGSMVGEYASRISDTLAPWDAGRTFLNFAERPVDGDRLIGAEAHGRLREVRAAYDPEGRFQANHVITPAGE